MSFLWHGLTEQGAQVPVQVDAQGRVIAVDGTPGISNWERTGTVLSPAVPGDVVDINSTDQQLTLTRTGERAYSFFVTGLSSTDGLAILDKSGGDVELFRFTRDGCLGIGTNRPLNPLSISSDLVPQIDITYPGVRSYRVGVTDTGVFQVFERNTPKIQMDAVGNVDIIGTGTVAAPNISLNADGSGVFTGLLKLRDDSSPYIYLERTGAGRHDGAIGMTDGGNISFRISPDPASKDWNDLTERARISDTGALLIGGTLPSAPNISLNADGSATFAGAVSASGVNALNGAFSSYHGTQSNTIGAFAVRDNSGSNYYYTVTSDGSVWIGNTSGTGGNYGASNANITLNASDGSATFAGNITAPNVTFRSADPQFYVKKSKNKDAAPEYVGPELDLLAEIARLEALVRHLYETLRMTPPAGWPVWDGNDDVLRQLRK